MSTPIYGLRYLELGEPARNTRAVLQENAETIEAALQAGGVAAPGASDLLAVSGRVSVLENDEAAYRSHVAIPFSTGWVQHTSTPNGETFRAWKQSATEVTLAGLVQATVAVAAGATTTIGTLPVGYRPAVQVVRSAFTQSGGSATAPIWFRVNVNNTGAVQIATHIALPINTFIQFEHIGFRTVNT